MPPSQMKSKKRSAPSSNTARSAKKTILSDSNGNAVSTNKTSKKRSKPVTAPIDEEDEEDWEDENGELDDVVDESQGLEEDGGMDVDGEKPPKDPNAARESHKAQKVLLAQRRAAKPHSNLLVDAKRLWAQARRIDITATERKKHVDALMALVRGRVKELVLKHDASRIIQTLVKRGITKDRDEVAQELKGQFKSLAQSRYSKFLVAKLLRLCPTHRPSILAEFAGSVPRLLLHREAAGVLADVFELHANAAERGLLLRDFYGPEARLGSFTAGSKEDTDMARKGLAGLLEGTDVERRKRIMTSVKDNLLSIFNNPDKGAITHAIVHRVLWEYLMAINEVPDGAERERLRREMFDNCQDVLAEMVHTRDGSRAVRELIAQGTAKDRKQVVKGIKPHVERMCISDDAQLVLFSALDIIDDTKLTGKSLVADIIMHASTLAKTSQGRRAIIYPLMGRSRKHLTPAQIASLAETDGVRATTSKKDDAVRADEVRKACSEGLLEWVVKEGAMVSRDTGGSLVLTDILLFADGDKVAASKALLQPASAAYPSNDESLPHPLDLAHTSRLYKTLLQGGHFSQSSHAVETIPYFSASIFAHQWVEIVGQDVTIASATGAGAFVVSALCDQLVADDALSEARRTAQSWFGKEEREKIGTWEGRGKAVLEKSVDSLLASGA